MASNEQASEVFDKLQQVADRFLKFKLAGLCPVLEDVRVSQAICRQQPLLLDGETSRAGDSINTLAEHLLKGPLNCEAAEQLLEVSASLSHFVNDVLRNIKSG